MPAVVAVVAAEFNAGEKACAGTALKPTIAAVAKAMKPVLIEKVVFFFCFVILFSPDSPHFLPIKKFIASL